MLELPIIDPTIIEKPIYFQNVANINEKYKVVNFIIKDYPHAASVVPGEGIVVRIDAELPASYAVFVTGSDGNLYFITEKTSTGFFVYILPRDASFVVDEGSFDCLVVYEI